MSVDLDFSLGSHQAAVKARLDAWSGDGFARRLWNRDPTLWRPEGTPEITNRLGWLDLPETMTAEINRLRSFSAELVAERVRHVVVLGMGGSSLAPEVYQATLGNAPGHPELLVLDSTHPAAVEAITTITDPLRTVFVVASKSGGTLETLSFFRYFWARTAAATDAPGSRFVAVTDPGTSLAALAEARSFRHTFLATPDVGGRYSALTMFGLVPAAAIGADVAALLEAAWEAAGTCGPEVDPAQSPGLRLGAALGELALAGRDKVTLATSSELSAFPAWIEQLIAESTGKEGKGIVPIVGERLRDPAAYGNDRFFVHLTLGDPDPVRSDALATAGHPVARMALTEATDLAAAMFVFEVAVAAAGSVLGIQPFDQPDVQVAKDLAKKAMAGDLDTSNIVEIDAHGEELATAIRRWADSVQEDDYIGIQAFLAPDFTTQVKLEAARKTLGEALGVATTVGYGPRFLHSTGQLHKGGPNRGVFLQIVDRPQPHLDIPETDYDFGSLVTAQALGDNQALVSRSRRVLLVNVGDSVDAGLVAILKAIEDAVH